MSKISSKKQKEVLMQDRKNGVHQGLIDIIGKPKCMMDPFENWHKGQEMASKLFLGSDCTDIIAKAKTAAVFGRLLDWGLDLEDLEAAINEVNNAD